MFINTKSTNRYRDILSYVGIVFLTLYYFNVCNIHNVFAADEDIDIPYTDTYGYTYDPISGQFVKGGDQQDTANKLAAEKGAVVNNDPTMSINSDESNYESVESEHKDNIGYTGITEEDTSMVYMLGGVIATLILICCCIRWGWLKN